MTLRYMRMPIVVRETNQTNAYVWKKSIEASIKLFRVKMWARRVHNAIKRVVNLMPRSTRIFFWLDDTQHSTH